MLPCSLSRGPPAAHGVAPLWGTPGGSGDATPPYPDPTLSCACRRAGAARAAGRPRGGRARPGRLAGGAAADAARGHAHGRAGRAARALPLAHRRPAALRRAPLPRASASRTSSGKSVLSCSTCRFQPLAPLAGCSLSEVGVTELLGTLTLKRLPRAGVLGADGLIACQCKACRAGPGCAAGARVSCSDFEEHAGSRERRPAESTFLAALGLSLRVRPRAPAVLSGRRGRACAACPVAACPAARQCAAATARQGAQSPAPLWCASGSAAGWPGGGLRFPDMRDGAHAAAPRRQRLFRIAQRMMRGRRARRRTSARWRARSRRAWTGTRSTAAPAAMAATCSAATAARPPPTRPASAWAPRPRCMPGAARCPLSPFCSTRRACVVQCLAGGAWVGPPCCAARPLAGAALQHTSALLLRQAWLDSCAHFLKHRVTAACAALACRATGSARPAWRPAATSGARPCCRRRRRRRRRRCRRARVRAARRRQRARAAAAACRLRPSPRSGACTWRRRRRARRARGASATPTSTSASSCPTSRAACGCAPRPAARGAPECAQSHEAARSCRASPQGHSTHASPFGMMEPSGRRAAGVPSRPRARRLARVGRRGAAARAFWTACPGSG